MALPGEPAEPPMEEILASIRRIISEEPSEAAVPGGEASVGAPAPEPKQSAASVSDRPEAEQQEGGGEVASFPTAEPAEAAAIEGAPIEAAQTGLLSAEAGERAASAFDRLAGARVQGVRADPGYLMPSPGRTLEDVTRELLAPLLKTWLDEHLPAIVEARVDEEVTRIARGRVR